MKLRLAVLCLLGACGGENIVEGTVQGMAIPEASASSSVRLTRGGGIESATIRVVISDIELDCSEMTEREVPQGTTWLYLALQRESYQSMSISPWDRPIGIQPGDFEVGVPGGSPKDVQGMAVMNRLDACSDPTFVLASSGTVTLFTTSGSSIEGTFDLSFPGGDRLTGSFDAPTCAGPLNNGFRCGSQ